MLHQLGVALRDLLYGVCPLLFPGAVVMGVVLSFLAVDQEYTFMKKFRRR